MINFLIAVALILFIIILVVYIIRIMNTPATYGDIADEEVTTTTTVTTTTVTEPVTVTVDQLPTLERHFKTGGQPFVIDPVDGDEWMLNTNDDMYEDGAGKWWRLVDPAIKV